MGIGVNLDVLTNEISGQLSEQGKMDLLEGFRNPKNRIQYMISGTKTIESRITKNKCIPYGKVEKDDLVLLKQTGGPVLAVFSVNKVYSYETRFFSLDEIRKTYQKQLCIHDDWWERKKDAGYATLLEIREIAALKPISLSLYKNRQSWIILRERVKRI